jgi:hypothetical protein
MENNQIGYEINTSTGASRYKVETHKRFYEMKSLAVHLIEQDNYDLAIECIKELKTMVSTK